MKAWPRFYDPSTGRYLDNWQAERDARREAEAQRDAEAAARREAEAHRDAETAARREAEAEIRRLREQLRGRQQD